MNGRVEEFSREIGGVFFGQFTELRPVQQAAIEPLCAGRNVILSAGTGSGKTEAVMAPLISRFRREAIRDDKTVILYVCPTKALINDLARRLEPPLDRLGLRLAVRHGDRNNLDIGGTAHVVLTTPESLGILALQNHELLATIRAVVLDEVHLLYNNQRGLMTAVLLHRVGQPLEYPLQVAALSATVGQLDDIRTFIMGEEGEADTLDFPATRTIDGAIRPAPSEKHVAHLIERLMQAPRRKLLLFVNSRREAEDLAAEMKAIPALADLVATHHSSLSTDSRETIENWFGAAERAVCISTSTLEMGIDIGDIDAVLLYGPPPSVESFLQRIGRGNRRSNKTNVICLSRDADGSIRESAIFSTMVGLAAEGRMPARGPFKLFGAVAQQCLSVVLREEGAFTRISDLCEEVGYRSDLDRPMVEEILDELEQQEFLQRHGFKNRFGATDRLWELKEKNLIWGNFPLAGQTMDLESGGRIIGTIPRVNLMRLTRGSLFRFGGVRYRVVRMVDRNLQVSPAPGKGGEAPLIFGMSGAEGLDAFVAGALWEWLFSVTPETSFIEEQFWAPIDSVNASICGSVSSDHLPYSVDPSGVRYYTFAGITVNRVILQWLGLEPDGADDLSIVLPDVVDWRKLPTDRTALLGAVENCFNPSGRQTIFQQCLPLELQRREWIEEWLRDDDAEAALVRLAVAKPVLVPSALFQSLFA